MKSEVGGRPSGGPLLGTRGQDKEQGINTHCSGAI